MSDWPFEDAENTASLSMRPIFADGHPILFVTHDEEDGTWQFLTGGEPRQEDAMLVSLGSVFELDPSVGELADLPLGASASRESADAPWVWHMPGITRVDPVVEGGADPWTLERYQDFLSETMERLQAKQATLQEVYQLGEFERFDYDLDSGTITFTQPGSLRARVVAVGSISDISQTWLWGWNNGGLPDEITDPLQSVFEFGEEHGLRELTVPKWLGDQPDAWAMTAAAAELLDAAGAYRAPHANGALFLLLFDLELE